MNALQQNFYGLQSQLFEAEKACGHDKGFVKLLAVSKTQSASDIAQLYQLGQRHFGENYLQEALDKQRQLEDFDISWHFIGAIQANKTKTIASHFSWVHSIERLKIAKRLSEQRPNHLPALNLCLQVNMSDEATKSGIKLTELPKLAVEVSDLPNIRLRGVMTIPALQTDYELQCAPYRKLYQAVVGLKALKLDTFSFGMSGDLNAAIAEGSTIVRIGSALFGKRD